MLLERAPVAWKGPDRGSACPCPSCRVGGKGPGVCPLRPRHVSTSCPAWPDVTAEAAPAPQGLRDLEDPKGQAEGSGPLEPPTWGLLTPTEAPRIQVSLRPHHASWGCESLAVHTCSACRPLPVLAVATLACPWLAYSGAFTSMSHDSCPLRLAAFMRQNACTVHPRVSVSFLFVAEYYSTVPTDRSLLAQVSAGLWLFPPLLATVYGAAPDVVCRPLCFGCSWAGPCGNSIVHCLRFVITFHFKEKCFSEEKI